MKGIDLSEEVCMICIAAIAITAMFVLGEKSDTIVAAIGGGLIGYLKRVKSKDKE